MKKLTATHGHVRFFPLFFLLAFLVTTKIQVLATTPTQSPWIMHRIDPAPEPAKYGAYNSLGSADFNKDGFTDYAVIHEFLGWIGVTIIFHPGVSTPALYDYWEKVEIYDAIHVEHCEVGDFDKDGNPDILMIGGAEHDAPADIRILWCPDVKDVKKNSAWKSMSFGTMGAKGGNAHFGSVHDIDKDGDLDFFVGGRGETYGFEQNQNHIGLRWAECPDSDYRNINKWKVHVIDDQLLSGHGHFFTDLDQDSDDDIVVNNADFNTSEENRALIWYENPGIDKITQPWTRHVIHKHPDYFVKCQVDAGDLDQDGLVDLVVPLGYDKILWFKKTSNDPVQFERIEIQKPDPILQVQRPIKIYDVNQDGKMDIVGGHLHYAYHTLYGNPEGYISPEKYSLYWMEYNGDEPQAENWTVHCVKRAFGANTGRGSQGEKFDHVKMMDIDQDGDMDIIANSEESYVRKDSKIHTYFGVAWFENAETAITASDDFESGSLAGGDGWSSEWETQGNVKVIQKQIQGENAIELRGKAVVTRSLKNSIDNGQLEFRWITLNDPEDFAIEVYDGNWQFVHKTYPLAREESLPYKNEMLALSKFGPVTKIRISLNGATKEDILYVDDVIVRIRVRE